MHLWPTAESLYLFTNTFNTRICQDIYEVICTWKSSNTRSRRYRYIRILHPLTTSGMHLFEPDDYNPFQSSQPTCQGESGLTTVKIKWKLGYPFLSHHPVRTSVPEAGYNLCRRGISRISGQYGRISSHNKDWKRFRARGRHCCENMVTL